MNNVSYDYLEFMQKPIKTLTFDNFMLIGVGSIMCLETFTQIN